MDTGNMLHTNSICDVLQAGKGVGTSDVHRAAAANSLTARAAEGKRRIDFILNLNQCVEHHRTALSHVHSKNLLVWLGRLLTVESVNLKLHLYETGR